MLLHGFWWSSIEVSRSEKFYTLGCLSSELLDFSSLIRGKYAASEENTASIAPSCQSPAASFQFGKSLSSPPLPFRLVKARQSSLLTMDHSRLLDLDVELATAEVLVPSLRQLGQAADEYAARLQAAASAQDGADQGPSGWPVSLLLQCLRFRAHPWGSTEMQSLICREPSQDGFWEPLQLELPSI